MFYSGLELLSIVVMLIDPNIALVHHSFKRLGKNTRTLQMSMDVTTLLTSSSLEAIKAPVESYVNIWVPLFKSAEEAGLAPEFLIHWGHGAAMSAVLLFMGGIGTFLGWQIRLNNGEATYPVTLGKTAREQHPLIMGLASFFFLLGGQGGLVLLAVQGKPILESPHALTAVLGLALLAVQALLPTLFGKNESFRSVHAYLGSATMLLLVIHGINGLNLGLSI